MSKDKIKIRVEIDPWDEPKGHSPHKSGSGFHDHKNTKRKKTRAAQKRDYLEEFYEEEEWD